MSVLGTELKRSSMLVAAPLLVFLGALATWRGLVHGVRIWDVTGTALLGAIQLMGPVSAGIAAWAAGRERRRKLRYLRVLGVRNAAALPLIQLTAAVIWAVAAYLLVVVFFVARSGAGHYYGSFSIGPPAAAVAGLALHVVAGFAIGLALPWPMVPPLVVLLAYVYEGWNFDYGGRPRYLLSPVTVEQADPFHTWPRGLFAQQSAWYVLVAGSVVLALALALTRNRRLVLALVVSLGLAGVAADSLRGFHGHFFAAQPPLFTYSCAQSTVRVCVHPAFGPALPDLLTAFGNVQRRLDGTPVPASSFRQLPRGPQVPPGPGQPIHLDDLSAGYAERAAAEFTQGLLDLDACSYDAKGPSRCCAARLSQRGWPATPIRRTFRWRRSRRC